MLIEPKIIKTEVQYQAYLAEVDRLAADDPAAGTPAGNRLELLAKLVEAYEKKRFKFKRPDPGEAILFRWKNNRLRPDCCCDVFCRLDSLKLGHIPVF